MISRGKQGQARQGRYGWKCQSKYVGCGLQVRLQAAGYMHTRRIDIHACARICICTKGYHCGMYVSDYNIELCTSTPYSESISSIPRIVMQLHNSVPTTWSSVQDLVPCSLSTCALTKTARKATSLSVQGWRVAFRRIGFSCDWGFQVEVHHLRHVPLDKRSFATRSIERAECTENIAKIGQTAQNGAGRRKS